MAKRVQQQPVPDAILTREDGKQYQSVNVGRSRPFARACLDAWKRLDGKDRSHMMGFGSIWVPVELIATARAALEEAGQDQ